MKARYIGPLKYIDGKIVDNKIILEEKILNEEAYFYRNYFGVLILEETNNPISNKDNATDIVEYYLERNMEDNPRIPFADEDSLTLIANEDTKQKRLGIMDYLKRKKKD